MAKVTSLTGLEIRIIKFFLEHITESFAIREIARKAKIDYKLVHTVVQRLVQRKVLDKKRQANIDLCSLSFIDLSCIYYVENLRAEEFLQKNKELRRFFQEVQENVKDSYYTLLLFGSFAKRTENKYSDVDLLIISPERSRGEEIERAINTKALLLKRKVQIIVLGEKEFIDNLSSKQLNVVKEAFKHHLILFGAEAFYAGVKQAI